MMKILKNSLRAFVFLLLSIGIFTKLAAQSQGTVIDQVVGIVGGNIILQSEMDAQYQQLSHGGEPLDYPIRCKMLEDLLYQKLLLTQAQKDSLTVTDAQIEQEQDRRLGYFMQQFGSEEKFVEYYGKSVESFKSDLREDVRDLLLSQQMQNKVISNITVTPSEVKAFFESIPPDSVAFINEEVEVAQLVKKPKVTLQAKKEAKEKITGIRNRIMKGESTFSTMAALYSQDPGSSSRGGLYEGIQRGQFVPEWDAWAFRLKPNEISEVFETMYGYFLIQLIQRRGDVVDARSLLIAPKVDALDLLAAKEALDTMYNKLSANDSISFSDAVAQWSDDDETKHNGGLLSNPYTGATRFQVDELGQIDQNVAFAIDKLKVGEMTKPMPFLTKDGKQAYQILCLKSRIPPHRMSLASDYQKIQTMALNKKQHDAIQEWIKKKATTTFVKITEDYKTCPFSNKWNKN